MNHKDAWSDGVTHDAPLWTYPLGHRQRGVRNEALFQRFVEARKVLIAAALAWRDAAVADGWACAPTYAHEHIDSAFTLTKGGWHAHGIARPADFKETAGSGSISVWAPDGMHVQAPRLYDMAALQAGLRYCENCDTHDVDTQRYSFAGRCCSKCRPLLAAIHERPG